MTRSCASARAGCPRASSSSRSRRASVRSSPTLAAGWLSTDPATLLYTDAVVENVAGGLHLELFENELITPDFGKFADIVRQAQPVSVLSLATGGEPGRSPRHRTIHRPNGFSGELRAAFVTGGACWGVACLTRAEGEPDFTTADADFVGSICEYVAHGLRTALLLRAVDEAPAEHAPGMVVLAADDSIESISDAAERWLAELPRDTLGGGLDLPSAVHAVAIRARAAAAGDEQGVPRARVRTASGRWLVLHAACLHDRTGQQRVAVMIEPARRAEIASLVVELYQLTEREQQVTQLLVKGLAIDEIAQTLWLSRHTVRDYAKTIFAKLDVSSRPELTAKLFAEHFLPTLDVGVTSPQ